MFNSNNRDFESLSQNELEVVLASFDENMILDTIDAIYKNANENPWHFSMRNYVDGIENLFQQNIAVYPDHADLFRERRHDLYNKIIARIAKLAGLEFIGKGCPVADNAYTKASLMASFFIHDTVQLISRFLASFIRTEKTSLYTLCNVIEPSTLTASTAAKKTYKAGDKMAALVSNIPTVIDYILVYDINIRMIASHMYTTTNTSMIEFIIWAFGGEEGEESTTLFKHFIVPYIQKNKALITTNLRMTLAPEIPGVNISNFITE